MKGRGASCLEGGAALSVGRPTSEPYRYQEARCSARTADWSYLAGALLRGTTRLAGGMILSLSICLATNTPSSMTCKRDGRQ